MQVRSGGATGCTDLPEYLTSLEVISGLYTDAA